MDEGLGERVRGWKMEIFFWSLVMLICFSGYLKPSKEGFFSYWIVVPLVGVYLLYRMISSILNWIAIYIHDRDNEIKNLNFQLNRFICKNSLGWVENVKKRLCNWAGENPNILKVWIYGSRATGNFHEDSDLDVAIEIDPQDGNIDAHSYWIAHETELKQRTKFIST